jgi:SAM-dependent methyltransferase
VEERPGLRFGRVAEEYERVRPSYPDELVDEACRLARLGSGSSVVEIGCGTGKLTRSLVERGLVVEAVEPDRDLADVARRAVPRSSVRLHASTFEDVTLPGVFPAVFSAIAFHWVDPSTGWRKVARLLEPDGVFALLAHVGGLRDDLDRQLHRIWREEVSDREPWSWLMRRDLAAPEAAALFRDVRILRIPAEHEQSADEYLARLRTTNAYLHLDAERRRRLESRVAAALVDHGGTYVSRSSATLVTARRAPARSAGATRTS